MIILDVGTWYDLFGLNCQKEKKNLQVLLKCLSNALDPLGFRAWQLWYQSLGYDFVDFENMNWFWSKSEH